MADKRISQLVERVTLATNDVFPIVASGATTTNKVTLQTIDDYMQTNLDFGVTSVAISVPTGLSVTGTPITSTGTFVITFTAGYSIPTTAKQTQWDTAYTNRITSATAPLGIASNVISITQSGASSNGYLSSTDWNTFNNKQSTITTGNLTEATSSILTITGGTGAVLGSGTTIQVTQASGSQDGFLDSADWTTFNGKQNALSGTGIVKSTGGTISYLTDSTSNWDSAYNDKINSAEVTGTTTKTLTLIQQDGGTIVATWTDLVNPGTVTSVGVSVPSALSVSNSPITSSGTIAITGAGTISQYIDGTGALQTFPSGLPPTGSAGGDLQGTYPNPTVHRVHGIDFQSGTPTADDVWVYGGSPNKWQHQKLHSNQVTEDGNLFYTDARARASISESVTGLDYNSTTGVLSTTTGYSIPTNASQTNWTAAYDDTILSASVSGTTTKTLTLTQRDSGTITASWTDINTDAVSSVFGRTGAVVATNGDYNTDQVTEGTSSLYFTNARSRSSISMTTTGTSGAATYNSTTGVFNIPNYGSALSGYLPLTGGTLTNTGGNGNPILNYVGSSTDAFQWITNGLNSVLGVGNTMIHILGKSITNKNAGYFGYQWNADQSNANFISLGFINFDHLFKLYANGNVVVSGTITASNLSGTNTGDQTLAGLGGQAQLNGTGFIKATGTTITYDNSTYYLASNPSGYISSYTETDTLASVVGRGSTTTATISVGDAALGTTGINIRRGRLCFSSSYEANHSIYNNNLNIDSEGVFDGMKMNVYDGLRIRTGNAASGVPTTILSLSSTGVAITGTITATNLSGTNTGDQTLAGLGGVPTSRTLTINGTGYDLSADRSWTVTGTDASKLPLTGGTLTGSVTSNLANAYAYVLNRPAITNYIGLQYQTAASNKWFIGLRELSTNHYYIYNEVLGTNAVTIDSTNNYATFASQLQANSIYFDESGVRSWSITKSGGNLNYNSGDGAGVASFGTAISSNKYIGVTRAGANGVGEGPYVVIAQPTSAIQWVMQLNASAGLDYWHYSGSAWSTPLKLQTNGFVSIGGVSAASKLTIYDGDIRLYKPHVITGGESWKAYINFTDEVDRLGARIVGERTAWDGAPMGIGFDTGGVGTVTRKMSITSAGQINITGANDGGTPILNINTTGNGSWQRGIRLQNSSMSAGSSIMISAGYADSSYNQGQFYFYYAGTGSTSNRISMGLHSVDDVFNIMGTGNILINTTSENGFGSAKSIQLNGAGGSLLETRYNGTSGLRIGSGSDHSYHHDPRNAEMRFATSDSTRFYIYGNGNYSFTGSNVSDRRAKENIFALDISATDKIMSLEPKTYNMKNNPSQKRYGFIAQDVREILSDLVVGNDNDGYLGLDYDGLLSVAIKALQEQNIEIQKLKNK